MTLARITYFAAAALFLALLAAVVYEQVSWELYRRDHRCVEVKHERREHLPDRTTWRCDDGTEHIR